jgi:hypothetical protein
LWSLDAIPSEAIVDAATNALVAGLDSQSLRVLAGTLPAAAAVEVPELLPRAMRELGLPFFARGGTDGQLPAARALARELTAGAVSARALVARMHRVFGHDTHALIEPLVILDDVYDILEYTGQDEADVERQVLEAAERLLGAGGD